jgi:hypothetical protein
MPNVPDPNLLSDYFDLEDDKVVALYLSVMYWGLVAQNPKVTPTGEGTLISTAQKFQHYLRNP